MTCIWPTVHTLPKPALNRSDVLSSVIWANTDLKVLATPGPTALPHCCEYFIVRMDDTGHLSAIMGTRERQSAPLPLSLCWISSFLHSHPTPAISTQAIHVHRLSAGPSNLPGFGGGHGHQGPRRHRSGGHPGHCQPQPHCDQRRRWEQRPTCTNSFILLLLLLLLLLMMIIIIIQAANSICLSLVWAAKAVVAPAMTATDPQHLLKPLSPTDASWHTLKPADFCQPIKTPA